MRTRPLRAPPRPLGRRGDEDGDALVVARTSVAERPRPLVREPDVGAAREQHARVPRMRGHAELAAQLGGDEPTRTSV